MSIQGMRRRFAVHLKYVLYLLIAVFTIGLLFLFGAPGGFQPRPQREAATFEEEVIAKVDGKPLRRGLLERAFDKTVSQFAFYASIYGNPVSLAQFWQFRLQALDQAITEELLARQAQVEGISVSKGEVKKYANQLAEQQVKQLSGQYKGKQLQQLLGQIVAQTKAHKEHRHEQINLAAIRPMSEGSFRKWLVKDLLTTMRDQLEQDLISQKLRTKVVGSGSADEQEFLASFDVYSFRSILVAFQPSRASAVKLPEQPKARTEAEAQKRAEELAAQIKQGADFAALARKESDEPGADKTGGLREGARANYLPPELSSAISRLMPGEGSPPIKTTMGFYIIKLEKRVRELPKDFEKNKKELLANFNRSKQEQVWQSYQDQLRLKAKVEMVDPELRGYKAMRDGNLNDAMTELQKAASNPEHYQGPAGASLFYSLATLYTTQAKKLETQNKREAAKKAWQEAAEAFGSASDALSSAENKMPEARAETLMKMAEAYEHLGDVDEALLWYQAAGEESQTPTIHFQLQQVYKKLGKTDLIEQEQQWLANYQREQAEREKAAAAKQAEAAAAAGKPATKPTGKPSEPAVEITPVPTPTAPAAEPKTR